MILTIPDERLCNLAVDEREALVDVAIGLYKRDRVSAGRAAEIAGMSSPELLAELGRRQIPLNATIEDLQADVESLQKVL